MEVSVLKQYVLICVHQLFRQGNDAASLHTDFLSDGEFHVHTFQFNVNPNPNKKKKKRHFRFYRYKDDTWEVMTSMDAMKRSAMMDTPRNKYMSERK